MEQVNQQIRLFLKDNPNDQLFTDYLNNLEPNLKPTLKFHQIDTTSLTQPTLVYAHLMVQDIRDVYYYISFAMKRPLQHDGAYYLYKYGNSPTDEPSDIQENKDYLHVMTDRYNVVCMPVRYQTKWVDQLEGRVNNFNEIEVEVDGKADYKLGQIINIVAFYEPDLKKLYYVRSVPQEEAEKEGLEIANQLQQNELNLQEIRHELISYLSQFTSEIFAQYLLLCLISQQPFFLGCDADLSNLVSQIYPRVAHIKIIHPCNQSLFPFKNQDGQLKASPMQMSMQSTFISIDLSQFSTEENVVLKDTQFQNFAALKMFVQQLKTVYRWEIGQSQIQHKHRGIIVKASQLITPRFNPKNQNITPDFSKLADTPEQLKSKFRSYIQAVSRVKAHLQDVERKKIEKQLFEEKEKIKIGNDLGEIMFLSKLIAISNGRTSLTLQDFHSGKHLLSYSIPASQ